MAKNKAASNEQTPKVDAGDSGATVQAPGDLSLAEASTAQVQKRVDTETEQGFVGVSVSPDENDAFTFGARAAQQQGESDGPVSEIRDTFTAVSQHAVRPTNAGEVVEADKAAEGDKA